MAMFDIELIKGAKAEGGSLLTAFPSVGMVGTIASNYISDALKMERVAYVLSDDIPPAALVQEGVPTYPLRILAHKKLAVLAGEFQIPLQFSGQMAKAVLDWSDKHSYGLIIGLEGLMTDQSPEVEREIRVFGVGSTDRSRKLLTEAGIEQFKAGVITGVSGALLSEAERLGRDVICLLADANAMYPDAKGAAKLVESVTKVLPSVKVDLEELYQEAARIEENVKLTVERAKEMLAGRQSQAERLGRSYMYG